MSEVHAPPNGCTPPTRNPGSATAYDDMKPSRKSNLAVNQYGRHYNKRISLLSSTADTAFLLFNQATITKMLVFFSILFLKFSCGRNQSRMSFDVVDRKISSPELM